MNGESLRAMLQRHEGYRKTAYKCPAGHLTIGIGHNIDANPLPENIQKHLGLYGYITDRMIERLFQGDIETATEACKRLYPELYSFSVDRRNALIDFVFNVGEATAREFVNTNKAINDERWQDAANGIRKSAYYRQVGKRGEEIARMIEGDEADDKVVANDDPYPLENVGAI
jgi:lysozyme